MNQLGARPPHALFKLTVRDSSPHTSRV